MRMTDSLPTIKFKYNESLAKYNTWRVGGTASGVFLPKNKLDVINFFKNLFPVLSHQLQTQKIAWLGLGSNILIQDSGFDGIVIVTQGGLNQLQIDPHHPQRVRIEAGVACGTAARFCARAGLTGLEFLAGVPGTIGGALAMNAGAHGSETWQFVTHCETVDIKGCEHLRPASDYQSAYREVTKPADEWFLAAHFQLIPGNPNDSLNKIKQLLTHRANTQPINLPNCGSVFRNPAGHYAAKLIESCGLKNCRIGGARISEKHANFIVNDQSASATDIEKLILHIKKTVKHSYNIDLIREVHFLV